MRTQQIVVKTPEQTGDSAAAQQCIANTSAKKGRCYGLFPLTYMLGTFVGATFPLWAKSDYLQLFLTVFLNEYAADGSAAALLGNHLSMQLPLFCLTIFSGYAVFGLPLLLLCAGSKGALNGAVYTCVLAGIYPIQPSRFVFRYVLYELGSTAVFFCLAWQLMPICCTLFRTFIRRKGPYSMAELYPDQLLTVFICYFIWCLIVRALNLTVFPVAV